jgi:hypothetical protein
MAADCRPVEGRKGIGNGGVQPRLHPDSGSFYKSKYLLIKLKKTWTDPRNFVAILTISEA